MRWMYGAQLEEEELDDGELRVVYSLEAVLTGMDAAASQCLSPTFCLGG